MSLLLSKALTCTACLSEGCYKVSGDRHPNSHRMPTCAQADAVRRMGAEIVKNNQLLHQLAQQFPRTHTNCSVSTFDFQAAWDQASFLVFDKKTPNTSRELLKKKVLFTQTYACILPYIIIMWQSTYNISIAILKQVSTMIGH